MWAFFRRFASLECAARSLLSLSLILALAASASAQSSAPDIFFKRAELSVGGGEGSTALLVGPALSAARSGVGDEVLWGVQTFVNPRKSVSRDRFFLYDLAQADRAALQRFVQVVNQAEERGIKLGLASGPPSGEGIVNILPVAEAATLARLVSAGAGSNFQLPGLRLDGAPLQVGLQRYTFGRYQCRGCPAATIEIGVPTLKGSAFQSFGRYWALSDEVPGLGALQLVSVISFPLEGLVTDGRGVVRTQIVDWPVR